MGIAGGVGNLGTVGILKVEVAVRTLFLAPMVVLLRGNISFGYEGIEVAGDDISVGARVTSSGAMGEI